ncbi:bolA-like protein 1 [Xiphias gladius]|uniref:bolA-like protein 1 n=1 Tax=Xiphias gladius TaxID=8245 RepID=UPI001A9895B3|nr:bolA-like protein 1 [Xiphias gladius]
MCLKNYKTQLLCLHFRLVLRNGSRDSTDFTCEVVSNHNFLMLPGVLSCIRPVSISPALSRPLAHFRAHMDPDPSRPVERAIRTKLTNRLKPDHLEIHNESHMHAVPPGSESHFRVLVVSSQFEGLPLIQRHRLVNEALKEELSSCIHALAIQAKTLEQWGSNPDLAKSPPCMGGSRGDRTVEEKLKAGRE